ncbi:MAG: hypothetical protein AAF532_15400 [Planctomycetota bacterium]
MIIRLVREQLARRPFEAFELTTADGQTFEFRHPDAAILSAGGRALGFVEADGSNVVLDLLLVTKLRAIPNEAVRTPEP